jgi:two-component system, OmpR family, phosphate regulon response regulator PhoB
MARILLVEDEADLRQVVEFNLKQAGHEVLSTASGRSAVAMAMDNQPDVVLLDIMLPDISGLEVCRQLRAKDETKALKIIMMTARGDEIDRIVGFEIGADDYVVKPFSVRELVLRVSALVRRGQEVHSTADTGVEFGALKLDREAHRAWVNGELVDMTALEFKLLWVLFERRDRVQSRTTLLDVVWGIRADVTTRTVDTHVKRLREKLGIARDYIETVRGVGYRFLMDPSEASGGADF